MTEIEESPTESPTTRLAKRLYAMVAKQNRDQIAALRRWQPGVISMPVFDITQYAESEDEYLAHALTAHSHAVWHYAQNAPRMGWDGTHITGSARQIGKAGSRGPSDTGAARLVARLLRADTVEDLHRALHALTKALNRSSPPPGARQSR